MSCRSLRTSEWWRPRPLWALKGCFCVLAFVSPGSGQQAPNVTVQVEIEVLDGPIRVIGHTGDSVRIRTSNGDSSTVVERSARSVRIFNFERNRQPDWIEIGVPAGSDIRIDVQRRGAVRVEDVRGRVDVSNVGGPTHVSGRPSSLLINTTDGSVSVELLGLADEGPYSIAVLNGDLRLKFGSHVGAVLETRTPYNGRLIPKLSLDTLPGSDGDGSRSELHLSVNRGGPAMHLSVFNGHLYVEGM